MEKKIKAAVLGMGNMGKAHAGSIMKMEDAELVALCSYPADDAKVFADEHNLTCEIYEDAYAMIEQVPMDVLYICLPPFAHNGQLEAAAKKGIHIFIEKPIAMEVNRARSMWQAVEENKVCSQVGYHMRFGSAVCRLKELMEEGIAGAPTLYTANYECNSLHGPWWRDITKCGGQVFEQVIHLYDMALYLMGDAKEVSGHVANLCHQDIEGYTIEDTSISNIVFENGSLGSICGSNCAVKNQWNGSIRVIYKNMIADFRDHNHGVFTFTDGEEIRTEIVDEDKDATFAEDCYFMEVVRGKKKPIADVKEGFKGIQLVSGVVESSGNDGKIVRIG